MKEGEFSLRDWNSNCQSFRERIKRDEEKKNQLTVVAPPNGKDSEPNLAMAKQMSIFWLELLGATLLGQLVHSTQQASQSVLQIEVTFLCTDSFTTLCWIKNAKTWKPYVQHWISRIRELTNKADWNFCPGKLNPADVLSRGCGGEQLVRNRTWLNGPKFLKLLRDH